MKRGALNLKEIEEGYMGRFGKKKVKGEMMYLSQKNSNLKREKKQKEQTRRKINIRSYFERRDKIATKLQKTKAAFIIGGVV